LQKKTKTKGINFKKKAKSLTIFLTKKTKTKGINFKKKTKALTIFLTKKTKTKGINFKKKTKNCGNILQIKENRTPNVRLGGPAGPRIKAPRKIS